jgi:FO synthase
MNESITRAAGSEHGQETPPQQMRRLIEAAGRRPRQRTTLYGEVDAEVARRGLEAPELSAV